MKAQRVAGDQVRGTVDGQRPGIHSRPTLRGIPERYDPRAAGDPPAPDDPWGSETPRRVSPCAGCGAPVVAGGRRGPIQSTCDRCAQRREALRYVRAALSIAEGLDDDVLASALRDISELYAAGAGEVRAVPEIRNYPAGRVRLTIDHVNAEMAGPQLRALRWSAGLTAEAIATALGISETRVRRIELQGRVLAETAARYVDGARAAHERRVAEAASVLRRTLAASPLIRVRP